MNNHNSDQGAKSPPCSDRPRERLVYVLPEQALDESTDDDISLREFANFLWRNSWHIFVVTAMFSFASVVYAFLATEWYRAEALLAPAKEMSSNSLGGQLGGLAALAGVSVGDGDSNEAVATLKSRDFARDFIEDYELLPVFISDEWDVKWGRWVGDNPIDRPDIRDAVRFFHDNVLYVSEDRQTGLVTLSIEWTDPDVAANWANALVHRLNAGLRKRSLQEAETNVAYLQTELARTSVVTLQQSIGRLLESELQKLMLARGNDEFAFRVIDAATAPKERVRPKRALIAVLGTVLGGLLSVFGIIIVQAMRFGPKSLSEGDDPK